MIKPVRLDVFMSDALTRYYHNNDPLGVSGDFTTAPEISQLFGEIIGIWAVQKWFEIGAPSTFNLIEIGPGRGTLMADLLRGTKHISAFHDAMAVHLVETSPTLQTKQQSALSQYDIKWHDHLSTISNDIPCIIIANEFLDALPVRQFKYNGDGQWQECYIDGTDIVWLDVENPPTKQTLPNPKTGDVFEYSDMQYDYSTLISSYQGAFLLIDYGYIQSAYGDSLQALYKHKPCAITDHIGDADLTTHVDFEWLASLFPNTQKSIKTQRMFLKTNGIDIRYQQLNNPKLDSGYNRLIDANEMGELFKVLEIVTASNL